MDKLRPEKGFLHIVVSYENNDMYYTDDYLCLSFKKYLFKRFFESGFETVYFLDGDGEKCSICCANDISLRCYENARSDKSGLFSFFKGKNKTEPSGDADTHYNENTPETGATPEDVLKIVSGIMSKRKTAVVMSLKLMYSILHSESKKALDLLKKYRDDNCDSILIINVNADMNKSERYFFPQDNIMGSVLTSPVFPEQIRKMVNKDKGYFFLWDKLCDVMGDRVVFLNKLELKDYKNIVVHFFMSELLPGSPEFDLVEWFSLILWASMRIPWLRYLWALPYDDLDEEILIRAKDIEALLHRKAFFEQMINVSCRLSEKYGDPNKLSREIGSISELPLAAFVFSEKIRNDVTRFREILKSCFEKIGSSDTENVPWEGIAAMSIGIENTLGKYVYIQHRDHNAKNSFDSYFNTLNNGIRYAGKIHTKRLLRDKSLFDIFRRSLMNLSEYTDGYYGGVSETSNRGERKLEALFAAMINYAFVINNCMCYIGKLKKSAETDSSASVKLEKEKSRSNELRRNWNASKECIEALRSGKPPEDTDCDKLLRVLENIDL